MTQLDHRVGVRCKSIADLADDNTTDLARPIRGYMSTSVLGLPVICLSRHVSSRHMSTGLVKMVEI